MKISETKWQASGKNNKLKIALFKVKITLAMKTKPEGMPVLKDTVGNVSSKTESKKEKFLNIQKKWRNRQKGFKRKWSILKEGKGNQTNDE